MSHHIRISPDARREIDDTYAMLEKRTLKGAIRWYRLLFDAFEKISDTPESFPKSEEFSEAIGETVRFNIFGTPKGRSYVIYFTITQDIVEIHRVFGSCQLPK